MELRQIRYVLAVAEERSFSRAASRLHLAQPSLSQQIAKLEKILGVPLFHRLPQHVELTDAGQRFVQVAQTLVDMAEGLEREMRSYAVGESGKLLVGSLPITGAYVLPRVIPDFTRQFPGVELQLIEETSSHLEHLLVRGKIDISLLTMPITDPTLETIPADSRRDISRRPAAASDRRAKGSGSGRACGTAVYPAEGRSRFSHDFAQALRRGGIPPANRL